MKIIDQTIIDKLCKLSKLSFEDKEKERLISELNKILSYFKTLDKIDVSNIEPLTHVTEKTCENLRKDISENFYKKEELLSNTPSKNSSYIKVPRVIKK